MRQQQCLFCKYDLEGGWFCETIRATFVPEVEHVQASVSLRFKPDGSLEADIGCIDWLPDMEIRKLLLVCTRFTNHQTFSFSSEQQN